MKIISTSRARSQFAEILDLVKYQNQTIAIGRHNKAEALIIKFPQEYQDGLDDITNMNIYGGAFDFLEDEPDVYSMNDLKKKYV